MDQSKIWTLESHLDISITGTAEPHAGATKKFNLRLQRQRTEPRQLNLQGFQQRHALLQQRKHLPKAILGDEFTAEADLKLAFPNS